MASSNAEIKEKIIYEIVKYGLFTDKHKKKLRAKFDVSMEVVQQAFSEVEELIEKSKKVSSYAQKNSPIYEEDIPKISEHLCLDEDFVISVLYSQDDIEITSNQEEKTKKEIEKHRGSLTYDLVHEICTRENVENWKIKSLCFYFGVALYDEEKMIKEILKHRLPITESSAKIIAGKFKSLATDEKGYEEVLRFCSINEYIIKEKKKSRDKVQDSVIKWVVIIAISLAIVYGVEKLSMDGGGWNDYDAYMEKCLKNGTSKAKCKEQWKYIINH